ncbi:hypothetical protein BSL78_25111 [Apostichopus japonicus]|uniref:Uncharacterized protein n=1 Tax=Stichopus japonicus TaxID=307972 RepID=A0A2G8JQN8_STIJA|nr:hypothetical protein BSL78_25111 [Apostichopus japonicus]
MLLFRVWAPFAHSRRIYLFERATGAKLNPEKTKGLRLGSWRYRDLPFGASWSDQNIKINGIWFGYDAPCDVTWNERAEVFESSSKPLAPAGFRSGKVTVLIVCFAHLVVPGRGVSNSASRPGGLERGDIFIHLVGGTELVKGRYVPKTGEGWVGVVHLGSKLTFLLFKQLFVAVTDPGLPCSYFVRFWGGLHLRRWVPALFSNREPHSSTPNRWCVSFAPL